MIKIIDEVNKDKEVNKWIKRLVLIICILLTGVVYYSFGQDARTIINSAVLAPVAWSWIFKPICKKFGVDYKQIDNTNTTKMDEMIAYTNAHPSRGITSSSPSSTVPMKHSPPINSRGIVKRIS